MPNNRINQKIVSLWDKYFKDQPDIYAPLFYGNLKKNQLLFVGMNPSFSEKAFRLILKDTEYAKHDPKEFYKWSNISLNHDLINDLIKIENYAYKNYSLYVGPLAKIAKQVGLEWQHIDLFLYRETSQANFKSRILDNSKLNEFGLEQIKIFEEILVEVEPKCVIVVNALGSEILRKYIKNDLVWDEGRGFHWFKRSGKKIPMFFTSMLSGQRALDRWSYERLAWHVRQAMDTLSQKT